jgi:hypothetical protein
MIKKAGGMAQVIEHLPSKYISPEFKPQNCQKKILPGEEKEKLY